MWLVKVAIFLVIVAFFALRATRKDEHGERVLNIRWIATGVLSLIVALLFILPAFGTVDAGTRGVVLRFGALTGKTLEPGAYFLVPFVNTVEIMDVQNHAYTVEASAASKDLQVVKTKITVNYEAVPDQVGYIYEHYRRNFEVRILTPAVQETSKAATAMYNAEDLIAQRPLVKEKMEEFLGRRLLPTHQLTGLSITDFDFSPEFNSAIEAKVTATQNALTEKNNLAAVEYKAQQRVATATAEAEAIRIQAQAITQQGGAEYVNLKWVEKWNGAMPSVMAGEGSGFLMQIK